MWLGNFTNCRHWFWSKNIPVYLLTFDVSPGERAAEFTILTGHNQADITCSGGQQTVGGS